MHGHAVKLGYYGLLLVPLLAIPFGIASAAPDLNGYTAQYECRAGNPNCNVDVVALGNRQCEQTITPSMPWSSIDWTKDTICIAAGDHTGKKELIIPSSENGTSSNFKVLRYVRAVDNDDEPWNQSNLDRAKLSRLVVQGDYWLIHRLTFPVASNVPDRIQFLATAANDVRDVVINRVLVEGSGAGSNFYGISTNGEFSQDYQGLVIQNSVMRNVGPVGPSAEAVGISLHVGDAQRNSRYYIVNNEIYDWVSHPIQIGRNQLPTIPGIVVENNDLYVTSQLYQPDGRAASESPLSIKVSGSATHPVRVLHNRIWGARWTDTGVCCGGESGQAITTYNTLQNILVQNNVIGESHIGSFPTNKSSWVGNIFYLIKRYYECGQGYCNSHVLQWGGDDVEVYLNTVVDNPSYSFSVGQQPNVDIRCNALISAGGRDPWGGGGTHDSTDIDDNVFYDSPLFTTSAGSGNNIANSIRTRQGSTSYGIGDVIRTDTTQNCVAANNASCFLYRVTTAGTSASVAPEYCAALGCTVTDGSATLQAIRGPFVVHRKLRTAPEPYVIPYAAVHVSADESSFCPATFANRTGIGINDDTAATGIFAQDMQGATRNGTAGALQAAGGEGGGGQSPYGGTPWPIPGLIEAENFDTGGEGVAHHDLSPGNATGLYRQDVDVDLYVSGENGYHIGFTRSGEWVEYTVEVATSDTYTVSLRVASNGVGGTLHIEADGVDLTGPIAIPNTGGWEAWQTISTTVSLNAGRRIIHLAFDSVGPSGDIGNVNYLQFTAAGGSGGAGTILHQTWTGIPGDLITDLTRSSDYPNHPSGSDAITTFETPTNVADNYGTRVLGYVHAPTTGSYTFWIAGDNYSELWLSTNDNPANKVLIASVNGWTNPREWNKYASQQSAPITLTGGQRYYVEAIHKEGAGGDNLAVAWQLPGGTFEGPIPGNRLSPYDLTLGTATGTLLRHTWTGIGGDTVANLTGHPNYPHAPSGSDQLTLFEAPTNVADNYGTRVQGYLHAPQTGTYTLWIASDDDAELWLSTDANPNNKVRIASVSGWTNPREWNRYASQQSAPITLQAGQRYYIEALQKEGNGGDHLAVGWQLPNGTFERPIPASRLSATSP